MTTTRWSLDIWVEGWSDVEHHSYQVRRGIANPLVSCCNATHSAGGNDLRKPWAPMSLHLMHESLCHLTGRKYYETINGIPWLLYLSGLWFIYHIHGTKSGLRYANICGVRVWNHYYNITFSHSDTLSALSMLDLRRSGGCAGNQILIPIELHETA